MGKVISREVLGTIADRGALTPGRFIVQSTDKAGEIAISPLGTLHPFHVVNAESLIAVVREVSGIAADKAKLLDECEAFHEQDAAVIQVLRDVVEKYADRPNWTTSQGYRTDIDCFLCAPYGDGFSSAAAALAEADRIEGKEAEG